MIAALGPIPHGLIVGAIALLALWPVRRGGLDDRLEHVRENDETGAAAGGRRDVRDAFRRHRTALLKAIALGVFTLFAFFPEGVAIDWSALFLRHDLGVDVAASGLAFAAFSAAMATFRFLGDPVRDRFGAARTLIASLLAAAAGLVTIALSGSLVTALAGFAVMGIGLSNVVPIGFSAAGKVRGLAPGVGIAIATTFGYSGALFAPSVVGFAAERFGFPTVFLALAALLGVLLVLTPIVAEADRAGADAGPPDRSPPGPTAAGAAVEGTEAFRGARTRRWQQRPQSS